MILFCKKCRRKLAWAGHAEPPHMPRHDCGEALEDWDARQRRHLLDAYLVLEACNISGVVLAMARLMEELCDEAGATPDRQLYLRTHPALIVFVDKVHDMLGRPGWCATLDGNDLADKAFVACYEEHLADRARRREEHAKAAAKTEAD